MAVFLVGEVICLVISERDLSLLYHVQYDSYLNTSSKTPITLQLQVLLLDMLINIYITVAVTVFIFSSRCH